MKIKRILISPLFIRFAYRFIRLYSWTFRLKVENETPWMEHLASGGRVVLCTWHQQFFSLVRYYRNYHRYEPSLMISRSKDGDLIAGVANMSKWYTVRGSSSRGGKDALRQMIARLERTGLAAHILDGPRGPMGVVKHGAVHLALKADAVMVPVFVHVEKAWFFQSWDRFMLPKPFSRVTIRYGEMIAVRASDDADEIERQRKYLEDTMRPGLYCFDEAPSPNEPILHKSNLERPGC